MHILLGGVDDLHDGRRASAFMRSIIAATAICAWLIWAPTMAAASDVGSMPAYSYGPTVNEFINADLTPAARSPYT